ncbi:hypothetical protein KM043_000867 [Ampulex compressa]|nr:hypothetical protein KM043_000867 [Ampulex compressa]
MAVNHSKKESHTAKDKNTDDTSIWIKPKPNQTRIVLPTSTEKPTKVEQEIEKNDGKEEANSRRKVTISVDPDDPCSKKDESEKDVELKLARVPTADPRFQQQNQTLRCYVMYTDFYRNGFADGTSTEQRAYSLGISTGPKEIFPGISMESDIGHLNRYKIVMR